MYVLIDGENLDATLGVNILKRAPRAEERPRWDRVLNFNPWAEEPRDQEAQKEEDNDGSAAAPIKGLFYLNASQRTAMTFVQALLAIGWHPLLLTSENPNIKVVDLGIQKTLDAILAERPGADVVLGSHDVDYLPQIEHLLDAGHRVAVVCFREFLATPLAELEERGLVIVDLEYDVEAFNIALDRVYPMDVEEFDPYLYI